ncbi:ras guanine nucleotide exchange factor B isoform X1 [Drosophila takahashii]|uniref:ras guanine nucleotide exchange factor B isoform X1 n=1 Tax=Drosophila takahashii TaxID=29030 RepID=UPI0038992D75
MSTVVEQAATAGNTPKTAAAAVAKAEISSGAAAGKSAISAAATPPATSAPTAAATAEIEQLQQALIEKQTQLYALESACLRETERQVELEDSVIAWQDKYDRLYESHKRVQKVNQSLEDKMLKLVDRNAGERAQLTSDVATLSVRLAQANFNIAKLQREIERYKADISLAIQLLQCKPDSFVSQKVSSLPIDIQSKVSAYMRLETNSHSDSECSNSGVGVATTASYKVLPASDSPPPSACPFPPTAMVYSMRGIGRYAANGNAVTNPQQQTNQSTNNNISSSNNKDTLNNNNNNNNNNTSSINKCNNNQTNTNIINNNANQTNTNNPDMISPTIMAKFLEDELKANEVKHCDTCQCSKQDLQVLADVSRSYSVATQTPHQLQLGVGSSGLNEPLTNQLCLRCHSNLNSPSRTNSPYLMKMVKSSDSVISETKSSVSDLNDMDKLFTPAKKDDLMVNPILGHHRLCERTAISGVQNGEFGNGKLTTSTMMYPTTHLGAYAAEKYLLETSNLGQLRTGYQRRFLDGGGTALQLLNKYEASAVGIVQDDLEDESSKPLLSGISQPSLLDSEQTNPPQQSVTPKLEDVCEPPPSKPVAPVAPPGSAAPAASSGTQLKSTNSGSVQSLWSNKTSSCEGAKMFETFNRNLIKTIKAENPKYRGPRLCAMRIQQNGQSNILLDNLESIETYTPVIYKRREKLLDEELNDGKDIITSKESNAQSAVEAWQGPAAPHENVALQPVLEPQVELPELEAIETKVESTTNPGVNSPKHSANSSSISDIIDYQESVLLRRQQLSRVAEWVQHNTQQLEQRNLQQAPPTSDSNSGTERQSSYSTLDRMDSISIEKLSMDSGYKTTPQQLTNGYPEKSTEDSLSPKTDITSNSLPENPLTTEVPPKKTEMCTTYYRRTTRSGLPVAYTTTVSGVGGPADESTSSGSEAPQLICPEQPTCDILNYKYYPNDTDKTRSVQAELHTTTQNVDIAQMEYNVKQFLLKQNEWSMNGGGNGNGGSNPGVLLQGSSGAAAAARMLQRRILGPGVGERVRMATPGGAVATKASSTTQSSNILPPHRTETNL